MSKSRSSDLQNYENRIFFDDRCTLRVQVVPQDKLEAQSTHQRLARAFKKVGKDPIQLCFVIVVAISIVAVLVLWGYDRYSQNQIFVKATNELYCLINYTSWLSIGEEEVLTLTLENRGTNALSGVKAYLMFDDAVFVDTSIDGSNTVLYDSLDIGERKTRAIPIIPVERTVKNITAKLVVESEYAGTKQREQVCDLGFRLSYVKHSFRLLGGVLVVFFSSLIGAIVVEPVKSLLSK